MEIHESLPGELKLLALWEAGLSAEPGRRVVSFQMPETPGVHVGDIQTQ